MDMYSWSNAICNACRNIGNEFIETTFNKSFKTECWSVSVTNAESCEYGVHFFLYKLLFKKKVDAQIYV